MRIELCASCLRAVRLLETGENRDLWLNQLRQDLGVEAVSEAASFELHLGQCQRLCPEGRVTLGVQDQVQNPYLAMAAGDSREQLVQSLRRILQLKT